MIHKRLVEGLSPPEDLEAVRLLVTSQQPDGTWKDVDYSHQSRSAWKTMEHLKRLGVLARAWGLEESKLHGDSSVREAALRALDWWLEHRPRNPNWWWNCIGVPLQLAPSLLVLRPTLSQEQHKQGCSILAQAKLGMTGQNRVWVAGITLRRAVLERDETLLTRSIRAITDEVRVSAGEGLQVDSSFHQHGPQLYNHGYGAGFSRDTIALAVLLRGTPWAYSEEKKDLLLGYVLDGQQWFLRGRQYDYSTAGREITRKEKTANYMEAIYRDLLSLEVDRKEEIRAALARFRREVDAPALSGNRHYWRSDIMAHHRPGFYASVRMYSSRTRNNDGIINDEGYLMHHVSDGCMYLMRRGDEYDHIFPVWDWQKLAGTTVVQTSRPKDPVQRMGKSDFVGGVSDGRVGLAAFDFRRDRLTARKTWIFVGDTIVCLGTAIGCDLDAPVTTTLNQCHRIGPVIVDGRKLPADETPATVRRYAYHDGLTYVPLTEAALQLRQGVQEGSWWRINRRYERTAVRHEVFCLTWEHGTQPTDGRYAYAIHPAATPAEAKAWSGSTGVKVLANRADLQAARIEDPTAADRQVWAMAFYRAGSSQAGAIRLDVDHPCLVLLVSEEGVTRLVVSDPTWKHTTVHITIHQDGESRRLAIDLPDGLDAGRSVEVGL